MDRVQPRVEAALTVGELTRAVQSLLGGTFADVWVRGEVSQPRRPGSGHLYLTLKDEEAVLPCVVWRSSLRRLRFEVEEGQEVLVRGGLDVYPPHGRYQLIVREIEPVGAGALQLAFEQLRARLEAEGLFAAERKRALPFLPRRIALITSATGAAVRDLVTVIRRRLPRVTLLLLPVRVQGEGAAEEVARALRRADLHADADVLVVGRGGGSLEDLQAFNAEVVARAIAACRTPVVSAVGHETDVTISDLVADVRAATPSQAGELVVPDAAELGRRLDVLERRLARRLRSVLDHAWQRVEALAERPVLRDAVGLLRARRERAEALAARLRASSPVARLRRRAETLAGLGARLAPPLARRLREARRRLDETGRRAEDGVRRRLRDLEGRLGALAGRLEALSPLAVLRRGYSITLDEEGQAVRRATDVAPGALVDTRLGDGGRLTSRVEAVRPAGRTP